MSNEAKVTGKDTDAKDIAYRCLRCRTRHSVVYGNTFFPSISGGHYPPQQLGLFPCRVCGEGCSSSSRASARYGAWVYRCTALKVSLTQICLELGVAEPTARGYMSRARQLMAMDEERRQGEMRGFGSH